MFPHHSNGGNGDHWYVEPELDLPNAAQAKKSEELKGLIFGLQQRLVTQTPALDADELRWERQMVDGEQEWTALQPTGYKSAGGATLRLLDDASILATGPNPQADTYVIEAPLKVSGVTGIRLEVLPDRSLPHNGPGRDSAGNFFLSDFIVQVGSGAPVKWKQAMGDESQDGYEAFRIVKKEKGQLAGWAIDEKDEPSLRRQAVFIPEKPIAGDSLMITLKHEMRRSSRNIGRFRISVTQASDPSFIVSIPAAVRPILSVPAAERSASQKSQLAEAYRAVSPLLDDTRKQMGALKGQLHALNIPTAMVMREESVNVRPTAYIRERGTFTSPGELVSADVPSAFNPLPRNVVPNRLALAQWLVSDDNPLTARVTANHFWEALFGHGIVETSEDFGLAGIAAIASGVIGLAGRSLYAGWLGREENSAADGDFGDLPAKFTSESGVIGEGSVQNLYAHGPRFRADAETVHDIALAESGLLSGKMFGPPVFPYQPDGVWDIPYSSDKWVRSDGQDRYRRAIYTFIRRSAPYPSLVTYDAPSREFCTIRRVRTNTPLQALTSLNNPYFFDAARAMAKRLMTEGGASVDDRIRYGFELTVSREPSVTELQKVAAFYRTEGEKMPEPEAWTMVSNVLLNTDEAITKE